MQTGFHALLPHSLRAKFGFALSALILLILASGGVAIYALHTSTATTRQLAGGRLAHMQDAQDLMQYTLLIARDANRLVTSELNETAPRTHADILNNLESLDRLVAKLAAASDDVAVLDLHQASQLFRNAANVATQLKLSGEREATLRSHGELQQQAMAMISAARALSARVTQDYQDAVQRLSEASARNQQVALALLAGCLLCAWLVIRVLLGRHVLERLRQVSHYLRQSEEGVTQPVIPVAGQDEIGDMARAVEPFLKDRRRLADTRASLEEERKRLAAIFQHTADGIVVVENGAIRQLNPAAERLFGWRGDEIIGRDIGMLISDLDRSTDASPSFDALARTREGWDFPIEVSISNVAAGHADKPGNSLAILVVRDATLRKEMQKELTTARDAAIAAQQAQAAFLANMSHELRTPLNAILGYAQILRRDKGLTERQSGGLETIEESGEHLLMLINDLLDLSKIEAGKIELYPDSLALREFLNAIAQTMRIKAEEKHLLFAFETAPDLPRAVAADQKRLRQILLNLLGNAVKFTDRGQVKLCVRLMSQTVTHASLRFEVEDSGIGMKEEQLGPIFQPFKQFCAAHRRHEGAGLGLAISRQLVRLMGGDIHVESRLNQGSRFWFDLDLPIVMHDVKTPLEARIAIGYLGARKRVLIVDDVIGNRALASDLLKSLGFDVMEAENGEDGLAQAETERPDLILMDIVMPVMDGLDATRRLKQSPHLKHIPVIVLSAGASNNDQQQSLDAGANAFHPKPFDADGLLIQIGELLGLQWIYDDNENASAGAEPLVPPPPEEMEVLHRLAMTGNMREIRERADHVASLDERYRPFADKLHALAETYQSEAILALIEAHLEAGRLS